MTKTTDMTTGHPTKLILLFAMPLLVGNFLQQLYNMVDSLVVGRFVGTTALAAVGTAFPVVFLLASLFMGLGLGAMVMVSQFYGAGDTEKLRATVDTIYTALIVGTIPLSLLGMALSGPIITVLGVPADVLPEFRVYLLWMLGGLIGNLGYNVNSGILQGLGDSKTPLLFLAIACALNIVLDLLFVVSFGWGVMGVAAATIIAQTFSWIFGIVYINKKFPGLHIHPFCFRFDKALFAKIIKLGLPIGVQQALFSIGVMAMLRLVNASGSDFVAGYNVANKIDAIAFMPIQSFSTAATTFVGQNIGANKLDRVKKGAHSALLWGILVSVSIGICLLFTGRFWMSLFSTSPAVIDSGMAYLVRILPFYWMLAIMFILNGIMRGAGETTIPLLSSILSLWLARVPAAFLLADFFGANNMHYCFAIGWVLGLAICVPYYLGGRWKNKSVIH